MYGISSFWDDVKNIYYELDRDCIFNVIDENIHLIAFLVFAD